MFKLVSALLLAAASIAPAHAATTIIVNSGNTALPAYTTAPVIQNFTNTTATFSANVQTITPATATFTPGGTRTFSQSAAVANGGAGVTTVTPGAGMPAGMDGKYLRIGSNSSYTISFVNNPVAYFSFVFSNLVVNSQITLNFVTGAPLILGSPAAIVNVARAQDVPAFGRVSYDVGTGSKIQSVVFAKTGGNNPFNVDSIAAAAPEPATWLMMILGFGLVGRQLRRRKGQARLAAA